MSIDTIVYFGDSFTAENSERIKHSDIVPELFGVLNTYNYAVAGASAMQDLGPEIEAYLAELPADPGRTAASILIGGNDYISLQRIAREEAYSYQQLITEAAALKQEVITETIHGARLLEGAGVATIVIETLPYANFALVSEVEERIAVRVVEEHNDALIEAAEAYAATSGATVMVVDVEWISSEIYNDPTAFGFVAPLEATVRFYDPDGGIRYDDDEFAFKDDRHPSDAAQGVVSIFTYETLKDETFVGSDGDDRHAGTLRSELILGGAGQDVLDGARGGDTMLCGLGADFALGGKGRDILIGGGGDDTLDGGAGADVLSGGGGNDVLLGMGGDDVLAAGLGADRLSGGDGADIFVFVDHAANGGPAGLGGHTEIFGGADRDMLCIETDAETIDRLMADGVLSVAEVEARFDLTLAGVEAITLVQDVAEIDFGETAARIADADLWGVL